MLIQIGEGSNFTDIIDFTDGNGAGNAASNITYTFNPQARFAENLVKGNGATITRNATQTGASTAAFAWTGYFK